MGWKLCYSEIYTHGTLSMDTRRRGTFISVITDGASEARGTGTLKSIGRVAACCSIETRIRSTHVQVNLTAPALSEQDQHGVIDSVRFSVVNSYIKIF